MEAKDIFMKDMTWEEIDARLKETDIALVPAGQTEQHGKHLPIDVDNIISKGLAQRVAEATFNTAKPVVAPQVHFSYSDQPAFRSFPGVFSMSPEVLVGLYHDVALSLVRIGFKKIIFISGHYPNPPFINEALRQLAKETNAMVACCDFFTLADEEVTKILEELGHDLNWGHACLAETSVSQLFGAEVRADRVEPNIPIMQKMRPMGIDTQDYEVREIAREMWGGYGIGAGPMGDPRGYSKEYGERIVQATIAPIIELVEDWADVKVNLNPDFLAKMEDWPVARLNK